MNQKRKKKTVVIGLLGTSVDTGKGASRWERWRPSISLCQHEDLLVDRFELLIQPRFTKLAGAVADDIHSVSPETKVTTPIIDFNDPWDFEQVYAALHDFARGYPFDEEKEEYLIHITTGSHVAQICLFLLTESHYLPAKLIQTSPPAKRQSPEPGDYRIIDLDLSKYDHIASRFRQEHTEGVSFLKSGIDTRNKKFNALIDLIEKVAIHSSAPILLTGPTGAGKSLLARRIYELKHARRLVSGDFAEVNSATIRGDAAMSALFGHVKGAFTGAASNREGLLRAADNGILFLDEIGELGADEQAMLLGAIEEKTFLPVGSDKPVSSEFQLIAGTNRDLRLEVHNGRFRPDLLARINLWTFELPGLAKRTEDIEPNLKYELDQYSRRTGTNVSFNKEARTRFLKFATGPQGLWKGNFRDLNGAVTRMCTLASGGRINTAIVDQEIERLNRDWVEPHKSEDSEILEEFFSPEHLAGIDRFDRGQLADVIAVCKKSPTLSAAGRILFAASRKKKASFNDADRIRKYLAKFGLTWKDLHRQ